MRKAQLSYILIMYLIIFVLLLFGFAALRPKITPINYADPSSTKFFIEQCITDTARFGLFKLGVQGGYTTLPTNHFTGSHLEVAYAYKNGNTLVAIPQMEQDLAQFIDLHLTDCVDNGISAFEQRFGKISYTKPVATVHIQDRDVRVEVNFPISIAMQNGEVKYDKPYNGIIIPVRLSRMYAAITQMVQEYASTKHLLKLECVMDRGFALTGTSFGPDNLFILEDTQSTLSNSPDRLDDHYRFFFVIRDVGK